MLPFPARFWSFAKWRPRRHATRHRDALSALRPLPALGQRALISLVRLQARPERQRDGYDSRRGDYDSPSPPRRHGYPDRYTRSRSDRRDDDYGRVRRRSMSPPPKHLQRSYSPGRGFSAPRPGLRERVCTRKYVELDEYQKDYAAGKYARLSREDKLRLFGSPHMPILVPLAPGETPEEYEDRFKKWLVKVGMPFEKLQKQNPFDEREYRIRFSNANALAMESVEPAKKRDRSPSKGDVDDHNRYVRPKPTSECGTSKSASSSVVVPEAMVTPRLVSCCIQLPMADASPVSMIGAYLACGCTKCLFGAMALMAERITVMDDFTMTMCSASSTSELEEGEIIDLL